MENADDPFDHLPLLPSEPGGVRRGGLCDENNTPLILKCQVQTRKYQGECKVRKRDAGGKPAGF